MKKETKESNKNLNAQSSSLIIIVSCISVLMLISYFSMSLTKKGTYGNSAYVCADGYTLSTSDSQVFAPLINPHTNQLCAHTQYYAGSNAVKVENGIGKCLGVEIVGVDEVGCNSYPNTLFVNSTCYRLNDCAHAPCDGTIGQENGQIVCISNTTTTVTTSIQRYAVNLHGNGGIFLVTNSEHLARYCSINDSPCEMKQNPTFSEIPQGKKFAYWGIGPNATSGVTTITIDASTNGNEYYAIWEDDNSGGGGSQNTDKCYYGTLASDGITCVVECSAPMVPIPSKENCETILSGYTCQQGATSDVFICKSCAKDVINDTTNYEFNNTNFVCQRKGLPVSTYTITFNSNGGLVDGGPYTTRPCTTNGTSNQCTLSNLPTATKDGYTFNGWSTDQHATSGLVSQVSATADIIYYATWRENQVTCTYETPIQNSGIGSLNANVIVSRVTSGDISYCCSTAAVGQGYTSNHMWRGGTTGGVNYCYLSNTIDFDYNGQSYKAHLAIKGKCLSGYKLVDNDRWCIQQTCSCTSNCVANTTPTDSYQCYKCNHTYFWSNNPSTCPVVDKTQSECTGCEEGYAKANPADEFCTATSTTEKINGNRCYKNTGKIVYVKTCDKYVTGNCETNPTENANVRCTLSDGSVVKRCDLADENSNKCKDKNVSNNPQTSTTAIIIAWIVGIFAIGYAFYYYKQTNKKLD